MKRILSTLLALAMVISLAVTAFADTWTCPECGEENTGEFCGECGAHVSATADEERSIILRRSDEWFCLKCGTVSAKKFCTNCGEKRSEGLAGSFVTFGAYEQDNDIANGGEPIEWIVLSETDTTLTLLSRYLLDVQTFDAHQSTSKWADCGLRTWLNDTFKGHAFAQNEQALLQSAESDDVMLLYYGMTDSVLMQRESRSAAPTAYARSKNAEWSNLTCWFINNGGSCGYVYGSGSSLGEMSSGGGAKNLYIRPVIRIRNVVAEQLEAAYQEALSLQQAGQYAEAIAVFREMNGYRDSAAQITACETAIKDAEYDAATALMSEGKYTEAYTAFLPLRGYKDVDTLLATDENLKAATAALAAYDVGNIVTMGNYGGEAVEWLVLAAEGDTRTMITVKGQDAVCFNKSSSDGNKWETSYIRTWLNETYYNEAFSAEEKAMITAGPTGDKVWLLSADEANKYFADDAARVCYPSAYAKQNGAYTNDSGAGWWWLRSPGSNSGSAADVNGRGDIDSSGNGVNYSLEVARPVVVVSVGLLTKS